MTLKPGLRSLPLRCAAVLLPALCGLRTAQCEFKFRLGTMDDLFHYVPGTRALVEVVNGTSFAVSTDNDGFSRFLSMSPDAVAIITLAENYYAGGVSLGQRYIEEMPGMELPVDEYDYTRVYNQPRAIPAYITTSQTVEPDPYHHRWSIVPVLGHPNTVGFQAQVAILLNPREIEGYQSFYGVTFPPPQSGSGYELGIVIRTNSQVDLGTHNLTLELNCAGHQFNAAPVATTYFVGPPALDDGSTTTTQGGSGFGSGRLVPANEPYSFGATVLFWDAPTSTARMTLQGVVEAGDNIILISSAPSLSVSERLASTVPEVSAFNDNITDCIPVKPNPPDNWTCSPQAPTSNCAVTAAAPPTCSTKTIACNSSKCGDPGTTHSSGWRGHWGGSISVTLHLPGADVQATGEYSYELTGSTDYHYNPGAGCGECKQDFEHFLACITPYNLLRDTYEPEVVGLEVIWDPHPCSEAYTENEECDDIRGPSETPCNRICN